MRRPDGALQVDADALRLHLLLQGASPARHRIPPAAGHARAAPPRCRGPAAGRQTPSPRSRRRRWRCAAAALSSANMSSETMPSSKPRQIQRSRPRAGGDDDVAPPAGACHRSIRLVRPRQTSPTAACTWTPAPADVAHSSARSVDVALATVRGTRPVQRPGVEAKPASAANCCACAHCAANHERLLRHAAAMHAGTTQRRGIEQSHAAHHAARHEKRWPVHPNRHPARSGHDVSPCKHLQKMTRCSRWFRRR